MTAHIQIGAITPRIQYEADGTQTAFAFPFPVFTDADIHVYTGETRIVTGFTVSGAGNDDGGSVSFSTAPSAGTRITLLRQMDIERVSDFQAGGPLRAAALNDELDTLTAIDQQLNESLTRCVRVGPASPMTISLDLPDPSAGAVLGWNDTGNALVNDPLDYAGLAADLATLRVGIPDAVTAAEAARTWAEDAALSAWQASLEADASGPGPTDDLTISSLETLGAATFGGSLTYPLAAFKVSSATTGAAKTIALAEGEFQVFTLGADTVFTLPDPPAGHGYSITLKLVQDATSGRTPSFLQTDATAGVWLRGGPPSWTPTPGAFDLVVLTHDGTDLIAAHAGGTA